MDINVERQMKIEALSKFLDTFEYHTGRVRHIASQILDVLDEVELSTQEEWMEEERQREAELVTIYSRESC